MTWMLFILFKNPITLNEMYREGQPMIVTKEKNEAVCGCVVLKQ